MPNYISEIERLRTLIDGRLRPLIDGDYVLLDLPFYNNIGDVLIWQGTRDFLRTVPFRCLGQGCFKTWGFPVLKPGTVILLSGGGNFGDLYPRHQNFRFQVAERYPDHRIIVLPQSIHYDRAQFLEEDMERLRRHPDLWICARDRESHDLLRQYLPEERMLLLPDMAFCIDFSRLGIEVPVPSRRALLVRRRDKEAVHDGFAERPVLDDGTEIPAADRCDWPGIERPTFVIRLMIRLRCWRKAIGNKTVVACACALFRPHMLRLGIRFIGRYEHVFSTRLHAAILAVLLGRETTVLDNSYGKNSRFFRTWFPDRSIEVVGTRSGEEAA